MKVLKQSLFLFFLLITVSVPSLFAQTTITVNAGTTIVAIPKEIFGNNAQVYSGSNNGADATYNTAMQVSGCRNIRWPGGSYADQTDWSNIVCYGTWAATTPQFITFLQAIGGTMQPIVNFGGYWCSGGSGTQTYTQQTHAQAVSLAEAWVTWNMSNTGSARAKYWEVGNESFGTGNWEKGPTVNGTTYGQQFIDFYKGMKAIDSSISIGAVACPMPTDYTNWTPNMLTACKAGGVTPDFLIIHNYPLPSGAAAGQATDSKILSFPSTVTTQTTSLNSLVSTYLGSSSVGQVKYFMTEYNSSLGPDAQSDQYVNAMFVSEWLLESAKNGWIGANLWATKNGGTPDYGFLNGSNVPYPCYYVFPMLTGKFGNQLVSCSSSAATVSSYAARDVSGNLTLFMVNNNATTSQTATINISGFTPAASGKAWAMLPQGTSSSGAPQEAPGLQINGTANPAPSAIGGIAGTSQATSTSFMVTLQPSEMYLLVIPGSSSTGPTNTLTFTATKTNTPTVANTSTFTGTSTFTRTNTSTNTSTATPTNSPTRTATPTNSPTPSFTQTYTATLTNSPTKTSTSTATNSFTSTNSFSNTPTNTATPTATSTYTRTFTSTNTASPTQTVTATSTSTNTATKTNTPTATSTASPTFSSTPTVTNSFTNTSSPTPTTTRTNTGTFTNTATSTPTNSSTPTYTSTFTRTSTNTSTSTPTVTSTSTNSPTGTTPPTNTFTVTSTFTNTATKTFTNTSSPTPTSTNTATNTSTSTGTPTFTNTHSNTPTNTSTNTPTNSSTPTNTFTGTASSTATFTSSFTPTMSATMTNTSTKTFTNTSTNTNSPTSTSTNTFTGTSTPTPTSTSTSTNTATGTLSPTSTSTSTGTSTNTPTSTNSFTSISTATNTNSPTLTHTSTSTNSSTPTFSPTSTMSATFSNTPTPTNTATFTSTSTPTVTNSLSATSTGTLSPTPTFTFTNSFTNTRTNTATATSTFTSTHTSTFSSSPTPTSSATFTTTHTPTFTNTSSSTSTPTGTPSFTHTATGIATATPKATTVPIIYPNPAPGPTVNILPPPYSGTSDVKIEIFTLAFRKVQSASFENVPSGVSVQVNLIDRWGAHLASGLYYVVVTTSSGRTIGKLLVLR